MENRAWNKEKYDDDDDDDDAGSDRISRLPESVLHQILCFLSQKKAVQTSVLSKSWRHLGPIRPVFDLCGDCDYDPRHVRRIDGVCEYCFQGNNEALISVLDNTFQRYHDHNLFPHELRLRMLGVVDSESISVLEKWISIIFIKPNVFVNAIHISSSGRHWPQNIFALPLVFFKVESLKELHLERCRLNNIISIDDLMLKNLQKLSLIEVYVSDETLEKVISACPLVKRLVLYSCGEFKTINIGSKNRYLNYFEYFSFYAGPNNTTSIAINTPSLESICIMGSSKWYPNKSNYFPHLKFLSLSNVTLSADLFHYFSCNFPRLQELSLLDCYGFEEIKLSSCSIKRLIIYDQEVIPLTKVISIDVPNILYFEYCNNNLPTTLSVTTTSREWKSHLMLHYCLDGYHNDVPRILGLFGMVKAVSQSQISLTISAETFNCKINQIEWDITDHPIVVQHLDLDHIPCPDSRTHFLNALFRIFRPRYMREKRGHVTDNGITKFLWKTLIHDRETTEYGWEQHLEEVTIEASNEEGKIWDHVVRWTCLPEWSENQNIRFRLKWKDQLVY